MSRLASDVTGGTDPVGSNLFLNAQIPLVDGGRLSLAWNGWNDLPRQEIPCLASFRTYERERIASRKCCPRIFDTHILHGGEWQERGISSGVERERQEVIEQTVRRSHRRA